VRRARLELADRVPELRRAARWAALAGAGALALIAAFVFANWALASALSSPLPGWRAPLVLAAAWLGVAVLVAVPLAQRWRPLDRAGAVLPQQALDEAEQDFRESLDRLADGIAGAAEERIAAAILPLAGGMVEVGEGMVEATDDVLEAADEITDVVENAVPGGVVVNRAVDIALAPGRLGVRVARRALTFGRDDASAPPSGDAGPESRERR